MSDYDTDWQLMDFDEPRRVHPKAPPPVTPKGTCPKCGKYIGRGVAFHVKACKK